MSKYSLRRFSNPETLKKISPFLLLKLLSQYEDYLQSCGLTLPPASNPESIDYTKLTEILMTPNTDVPKGKELSDTLYLVHEMSSEDIVDQLRVAVSGDKMCEENIKPNSTPADVAICVWLYKPFVLERIHTERIIFKQRNFEYFRADIDEESTDEFVMPAEAIIKSLTTDLDSWFAANSRGHRSTQILSFKREDGAAFMIRHGEVFNRQGAIGAKGKSESVYYRPEVYDVVVYNSDHDEIGIHASSAAIADLYRLKFGTHLFGNENFFPGNKKYTLEPLRENGKESLACADIPELKYVRLKEVRYSYGVEEIMRRARTDLFTLWEKSGWKLPDTPRITSASFFVKFKDSTPVRTVTIKPSNIAKYMRDDAEVLERFFRLNGFILKKDDKKDTPAVLQNA